jgi:glycosyltransferase involved in cell wall biosynthesis
MNQEPKHLFFLSNSWFPVNPGGQERYVFELTQHLSEFAGDSINFWAFDIPPNESFPFANLMNLGQSEAALWKRLLNVYRLFVQRKVPQFDAINLHFSLYGLPLLAHFPKHTPVTLTFHGPWALESQEEGKNSFSILVKRFVEKTVYQQCDRFIVLSKAFGSILHEKYQVPWSKIHVVPGGVDISHFQLNLSRREARARLGWPQDRPTLFTPRRLVQRMGLDRLISAILQVKQQIPNIRLAIAGKGALRKTLEQQVREFNLTENVEFLGFLPDQALPIAYQAADLTVIPSQSLEGFGLVLLESLACGTPTLCTPVGGMPEIVEPFCPKLVTQATDDDAIAKRLIDFLTDQLELPSREVCRAYAVNNFDWRAIAPKVREVLLTPNTP